MFDLSAQQDGLRVAITPLQLAAVLRSDSLSEASTVPPRLMELGRTLGRGVEIEAETETERDRPMELLSESPLAPASDRSDWRSIWSGAGRSLADPVAAPTARRLHSDMPVARNRAFLADIGVPVGFAIDTGSTRVASVRAGRVVLADHEARLGLRGAGETVLRHLGQSEEALKARLDASADRKAPPPSMCSFDDLVTAERAISSTLRANGSLIEARARTAAPGRTVEVELRFNRAIGTGVLRSTGAAVRTKDARVVLTLLRYNALPYFLLVAGPHA